MNHHCNAKKSLSLSFIFVKIPYIVGNKAKGRILKWVFSEIFRKTNISYPLISTRFCLITDDIFFWMFVFLVLIFARNFFIKLRKKVAWYLLLSQVLSSINNKNVSYVIREWKISNRGRVIILLKVLLEPNKIYSFVNRRSSHPTNIPRGFHVENDVETV